MSIAPSVPDCPPGFDCSFQSSCPSFILPCPEGFFCSSYEGFPYRARLDLQYARLKTFWDGEVDVTQKNKKDFIEPGRRIQSPCLPGFYCPSATEMIICPEGSWCAEATAEPFECDPLSVCPEYSLYQVNFINLILALVTVCCVLFASRTYILRQRKTRQSTSLRDPSTRTVHPATVPLSLPIVSSSDTSNAIDPDAGDALMGEGGHPRALAVGRGNMATSADVLASSTTTTTRIWLSFQDLSFSVPSTGGGFLHQLWGAVGVGAPAETETQAGTGTGAAWVQKHRVILPGVSGVIPPGKISVILGPTGCGKTTLLSLLRRGGQRQGAQGRVTVAIDKREKEGKGEGELRSRRIVPRHLLSQYIGYVPQEDILDRNLTVREFFTFNALARVKSLQPASSSGTSTSSSSNRQRVSGREGMRRECEHIVDQVLADLALQHVADTIIGGGENRAANISGGQLKRVNIGCELVAMSNPSVLLLDEPTAGLDSAIAYELVETLSGVAQKGVTILMVLQQPRAEIFQLIDHLFLMNARGSIVYEGRAQACVSYLGALGFVPASEETGDADFCVDVLNGLVDPLPQSPAALYALENPDQQEQPQPGTQHAGTKLAEANTAGTGSTIAGSGIGVLAQAWAEHRQQTRHATILQRNTELNQSSGEGRGGGGIKPGAHASGLLKSWVLNSGVGQSAEGWVRGQARLQQETSKLDQMGEEMGVVQDFGSFDFLLHETAMDDEETGAGEAGEGTAGDLERDGSHKGAGTAGARKNSVKKMKPRALMLGSTPSYAVVHYDGVTAAASLESAAAAGSGAEGTERGNGGVFPSWVSIRVFFFLTELNAKRLLTVRLRNQAQLLLYFCIMFIMAVALSTGFSVILQDSYYGVLAPPARKTLQAFIPTPLNDVRQDNVADLGFAQLLFFMSSALGTGSCLAAVPTFAGQLSLVQRERASGLSPVAYGLGRILADTLFVLANALVFAGVWTVFGHAGSFSNWLAVIVATAFASSALGYLTSAQTSLSNASAYGIILTFVFCVFSGVEPTLKQVENFYVVNWPWYFSFATWTAEATYVTWSEYLDNEGNVPNTLQEGADLYGFEVRNGLGRSISILLVLGLAMRALAVLLLTLKSAEE